jgi:hypothetical protein
MTKLVLIVLLVTCMFALSLSCSCLPLSMDDQHKASNLIFVGRVMETLPSTNNKQVRFKVAHVYKGKNTPTITITTASDSAMCGYNFETGKDYLVYGTTKNRTHSVSLCSRTTELDQACTDLTYLIRKKLI